MLLQELEKKNIDLKAEYLKIQSKIALHKVARWIKTDMKIRQLRKDLYGTK